MSAPHIYALCLRALNIPNSNSNSNSNGQPNGNSNGLRVLDIGTGTGHFAALCAYAIANANHSNSNSNGRVLAIDLTEDIVAFARERTAAHPLTGGLVRSNEQPNGIVEFRVHNCFLPLDELFDRINVAATVPASHVPMLLQLLDHGGRIVLPLDDQLMLFVKPRANASADANAHANANADANAHAHANAGADADEFAALGEQYRSEQPVCGCRAFVVAGVRFSDIVLPEPRHVAAARIELAHRRAQRVLVGADTLVAELAHADVIAQLFAGPAETLTEFFGRGSIASLEDAWHAGADVSEPVAALAACDVAPLRAYLSTHEAQPDALRRALGALLASPQRSDITLLVEGERVASHRAVLARRSAYFRATFGAGFREATQQTIELSDVSLSVFRIVLEYIYTGTCNAAEWSAETALEVLGGADYFMLTRVKQLCEERLSAVINADTIAQLTQHALRYDAQQLLSVCSEFIYAHRGESAVQAALAEMPADALIALFNRAMQSLANFERDAQAQ
jgi:protein-L-isoaspartate O-methyltransferase